MQQMFFVGAYCLQAERLKEVLIGQRSKKGLHYVSMVSVSVIPGLRKKLFNQLRMLHVYDCPFAGMPDHTPKALTDEKLEHCVWVEPTTKVLVEFEEWSKSGHLLHPSVVRIVD
ncbi:ATP dependent DNA ligase-like protein [Prosthecobacter fusiformis]|uniref:DNA ligase (ATP) n=1 Tax=Prosthecobacter fusiformis TaxID=48464 RepID=A0A4R7S115_9BACT|nr:hypothetical protein [Prosthecobacter fusiformis]TDU71369.1 ATP dependent DNA ligase-like protein [Prosthecobacter fusiformis]